MIKGILFDWDGTIVDSNSAWFKSFNFTRQEFNLSKILFNEYTDFLSGVDFTEFLKRTDVKPENVEDFEQRWLVNFLNFKHEVKPISEMTELIKKLKKEGYKTGLVSSRERKILIQEITEMGLDGLFDVIVNPEEAIRDKPNSDMLLLASDKLQLKPNDCVYIGDRDTDMIAARKCGMKSIGVTWGIHSKEMFKNINSKTVEDVNSLFDSIKNISD